MATTTNFGWNTPDDTDLVKDGALAIRTLGSDIDTALVDLKGGTTGQSLVKNSGTDLDYAWADNFSAGKNKIINGAMLIDQRYSGASVTINQSSATYTVDRFFAAGQATDGVFTVQQDSVAPAGFDKSLKVTVTTADASIGATQTYAVGQIIEGFNCIDLGWGSAGAKTVTLSFWVRSTLTGTFGGSLRNWDVNRSYPFTYSISSANTWEKKSIVITGDTTGTWNKAELGGVRLVFSLGAGVDRLGTAGAWNANNNQGATGQTQIISNLNATWAITGVQFEIGSVATAFQTATGTTQGELAACQRYYQRFTSNGTTGTILPLGVAYSATGIILQHPLLVQMRTTPTSVDYANVRGNDSVNAYTLGTITIGTNDSYPALAYLITSSTGLTTYRPIYAQANGTVGYIGVSAEL